MNAIAPRQQQPAPKGVVDVLAASKAEIAKALPKHLTPDRMLRICLTEIRKTPKLKDCDPYSFMGAVIQAAQLGLEPGSGLGHCYLIPYGKQVNLVVGYKGLAELVRRSGKVTALLAEIVYPEDHFDEGIRNGQPYLDWKPVRQGVERNPEREMRLGIAIATFVDGSTQWAVMERWEIERIRSMPKYRNEVWDTHYGEMAKKTVLRRLCKLLPQSPELVAAQALDDAAADGGQKNHRHFIEHGVIDASYQVESPDPAKFAEVSGAADTAPPLEHERRATEAETAAARKEFDKACVEATKAGLDPDDVLGGKLAEAKTWPAAKLHAGADLLDRAAKGTRK